MDQSDFQLLFESAPGLLPGPFSQPANCGCIQYLFKGNYDPAEEIIGRGLFEVFPDNPDDPYRHRR